MKRSKILSAILIILGIVPFAVTLICGLPIFRASNLTYGDFLILYSYLFWPTYILGAVLLAAGIIWRIAQKRPHKTGDS
ncbi:MAG: hypothetical protein IJW77_11200 [Clostridia bacterium]|nr:hypothetical protein [Clostridia bacterium]